jgi:DNA gyrase/topoisomerase IV subunit B
MSDLKTIIVKNENGFEVKVLPKSEKMPNQVMFVPGRNDMSLSSFQFANNGVRVSWSNGTVQGNKANFYYKDICIDSMNRPNMQSLCDYMNLYQNISDEDLNQKLVNAQTKEKTVLEKEIAKLEELRNDLHIDVMRLKQIHEKLNELKDLLPE